MAARDLLDKFEQNMEVANFINYDMLECKDPNAFDTIAVGEALLGELDQHKEVSASRTLAHINSLGLVFNNSLIKQLSNIASCNRIDGIEIDQNELENLAEMIKESSKPSKEVNVKNSLADANGISRQSMNLLAGEENDLLSDSLVLHKPTASKGKAIDQGGFPR